jgi:UDP-N-acetylglucosamine--N-acetylmuramyl-(pentapeptide) pyrophosphoryl-undecaprenol N-acetylglucosamine transferase
VTVRHLVVVGGGSAGHVVPSLPLIAHYQQRGWQISYVGSARGPERALIEPLGVPYFVVSVGKLRRYLSLENVTDVFRTVGGIAQAWRLLGRLRPDVVFSKGGYVSVPVVVAAWLRGVPVIAHESDLTPGLANRLAIPFADALCTNFPGTVVPTRRVRRTPLRVVRTGTPLRPALLSADPDRGRALCGAPAGQPLAIIVGGSLGAEAINRATLAALPLLTERCFIVHVVGAGRSAAAHAHAAQAGECVAARYRAYDFVGEGWGDLLAAADVVISRAGANSLYELLALGKPHLLIPLPRTASRGDQLDNARFAEAAGFSAVLWEEQLNSQSLVARLDQLLADLPGWRERLRASGYTDGTDAVAAVIDSVLGPDVASISGTSETGHEDRVR